MSQRPQGFPQEERLTKRADYVRLYESGKRVSTGAFLLFFLHQEGGGRRLGISATRKIGGAVVRNRIKRYVRNAYRVRRGSLADDVWMVIVARTGSVEMDYHQCDAQIERLLVRGCILSATLEESPG